MSDTDYLAQMHDVFEAGVAEPLGSETERLAYEAARTGALASSATEEVMAAARHLRALWQPEAARQSAAWWSAVGALFRAVDENELAR